MELPPTVPEETASSSWMASGSIASEEPVSAVKAMRPNAQIIKSSVARTGLTYHNQIGVRSALTDKVDESGTVPQVEQSAGSRGSLGAELIQPRSSLARWDRWAIGFRTKC